MEKEKMTTKNKNVKMPKHLKIMMIVSPLILVIGIVFLIVAVSTSQAVFLVPSLLLLFPGLFCCVFTFAPLAQKHSIKTQKYIQESSRDDLTDIMSTGLGIGIDATSNAIDENEYDLRNIADKSAGIMAGPMATMAGSISRGIKEGAKDTKFCKHCGSEIDRDSKFCSECGGQQ